MHAFILAFFKISPVEFTPNLKYVFVFVFIDKIANFTPRNEGLSPSAIEGWSKLLCSPEFGLKCEHFYPEMLRDS